MTEPIDVIAALRGATHSRHERLDTRMPLAKEEASLEDYREHLQLLHRWLTPLAHWCASFSDGPQDSTLLAPLATLPQITADLRHPCLGASRGNAAATATATATATASDTVAADAEADPDPDADADLGSASWRAPRSAAYRWGVAYVIEGSRLGGAVLYRRLGAQLAPHPLTYLQGSAAGPGPRWQAFLRAARAQVSGAQAIAEACEGACDAFDSIINLLDAAVEPGRARLDARHSIGI